jgi:hypothetical protein
MRAWLTPKTSGPAHPCGHRDWRLKNLMEQQGAAEYGIAEGNHSEIGAPMIVQAWVHHSETDFQLTLPAPGGC